jgi:protocatechuate 3,4-dioxygenase beta subunit
MNRIVLLLMLLSGLHLDAISQSKIIGGPCEDCELMMEGMPVTIFSVANIAPAGEPGEPMTISGTIYNKDGKSPAPGVILYVYHTDNTGNYSTSQGQTNGRKHGHLRGWVKTDTQGRYAFTTIRPAAYPNRQAPQHVHPIIKEPSGNYYWIDEYLFEDDPLLSSEERARQEKRGGVGIITLKKNDKGIWIGKRDIVLGLNIPNY